MFLGFCFVLFVLDFLVLFVCLGFVPGCVGWCVQGEGKRWEVVCLLAHSLVFLAHHEQEKHIPSYE